MGQRGWSIAALFHSSLNCKSSIFRRLMPRSPSYFRAKRAKPPMFCSAPLAGPREAHFSELAHIGPFSRARRQGIAIHSSLQRIAFLNRAMPQHESAPFLRIFSD